MSGSYQWYNKIGNYLDLINKKKGNKPASITMINMVSPSREMGDQRGGLQQNAQTPALYTGGGADGTVDPSKPVAMTYSGGMPRMVHEGEVVTNDNGKVNVVPHQQVEQVMGGPTVVAQNEQDQQALKGIEQRTGIPGYATGGAWDAGAQHGGQGNENYIGGPTDTGAGPTNTYGNTSQTSTGNTSQTSTASGDASPYTMQHGGQGNENYIGGPNDTGAGPSNTYGNTSQTSTAPVAASPSPPPADTTQPPAQSAQTTQDTGTAPTAAPAQPDPTQPYTDAQRQALDYNVGLMQGNNPYILNTANQALSDFNAQSQSQNAAATEQNSMNPNMNSAAQSVAQATMARDTNAQRSGLAGTLALNAENAQNQAAQTVYSEGQSGAASTVALQQAQTDLGTSQFNAAQQRITAGESLDAINATLPPDQQISQADYNAMKATTYNNTLATQGVTLASLQNTLAGDQFTNLMSMINSHAPIDQINGLLQQNGLTPLTPDQYTSLSTNANITTGTAQANLDALEGQIGTQAFNLLQAKANANAPYDAATMPGVTADQYAAMVQVGVSGQYEAGVITAAMNTQIQSGDYAGAAATWNNSGLSNLSGVTMDFTNLSNSADQANFAKGMADLVTTAKTGASWDQAQASISPQTIQYLGGADKAKAAYDNLQIAGTAIGIAETEFPKATTSQALIDKILGTTGGTIEDLWNSVAAASYQNLNPASTITDYSGYKLATKNADGSATFSDANGNQITRTADQIANDGTLSAMVNSPGTQFSSVTDDMVSSGSYTSLLNYNNTNGPQTLVSKDGVAKINSTAVEYGTQAHPLIHPAQDGTAIDTSTVPAVGTAIRAPDATGNPNTTAPYIVKTITSSKITVEDPSTGIDWYINPNGSMTCASTNFIGLTETDQKPVNGGGYLSDALYANQKIWDPKTASDTTMTKAVPGSVLRIKTGANTYSSSVYVVKDAYDATAGYSVITDPISGVSYQAKTDGTVTAISQ